MSVIEISELPEKTQSAWALMGEVAADSDLRPRLLLECNNQYAVQFVWQPNESYQKYFCGYWWETPEEAIRETTNILEDTDVANIFKVGNLFEYLSAEMLPGERDVIMTIVRADVKTLKNQRGQQDRIVLYFKETDKGFVVGNKTNVRQLVKLMGPETDSWNGNRIILHKERVQAFGQEVDSIRVRDKLAPAVKGKADGKAQQAEETAATERHDPPAPPDLSGYSIERIQELAVEAEEARIRNMFEEAADGYEPETAAEIGGNFAD